MDKEAALERKFANAWADLNAWETPKGTRRHLSREEMRAAFDVLDALLSRKAKEEAWERRRLSQEVESS